MLATVHRYAPLVPTSRAVAAPSSYAVGSGFLRAASVSLRWLRREEDDIGEAIPTGSDTINDVDDTARAEDTKGR